MCAVVTGYASPAQVLDLGLPLPIPHMEEMWRKSDI